mmetsp:Transcript_95280/g.264843  ORF Transcript_95280/g.264843 Transcript_95280/m.264843 type:complete len:315 (+) Transcript_95280:208-1152(+)
MRVLSCCLERRVRAGGAHEGVHVGLARDPLELLARLLQALREVLPGLLALCRHQERAERLHAFGQTRLLRPLLRQQPLAIPAGGQHALAREEAAHLLGLEGVALRRLAVCHDVEEGAQRRAHVVNGAVGDVRPGGLGVRLADVLHPVHEEAHVLRLGSQHCLVEHLHGAVEDAPQEVVREGLGDAVAKAAGEHPLAAGVQVLHLLQVAVLDQVRRVALLLAHAAPQLRHQQGDVVVDLDPANVAGGAGEAGVAAQDHAHQGGVQVRREPQRVERALGQCALGAGARGGRRLAGQAGDELHEQLRQLLEVQRVEH